MKVNGVIMLTECQTFTQFGNAICSPGCADEGTCVDYLISLTNKEALLADGYQNTRWLQFDSIIQLRNFTAKYIRHKKRKDGNIPECTHYIETANMAVNLGRDLVNFPKEVIAFAAYAHDILEDCAKQHPELSARKIVEECWKGDPKYRNLLINTINQLTDDPHIKDKNLRLYSQVVIANNDRTGLVSLIRYCDKLSTLMRDYQKLLNGETPMGDLDDFMDYITRRNVHVGMMTVATKLPQYKELVSLVNEELADRAFAQQAKEFMLRNQPTAPTKIIKARFVPVLHARTCNA